MVFLTKLLCLAKVKKVPRKYLQTGFMDSLRLHVKGGGGGHGFPKFGGIGGQGGYISVVATESISLQDVFKSNKSKRYKAKNGRDSSHNFILGPPGENVKIEVPTGVSIYTDDGKKLGELNNEGDEIVVANGGTGGHPKNGYIGITGQERSIKLDLKLIADIGLVGFPNAGKSTLLKAVSHARPKIASYPFTTVKPNVGIIKYKDLRQISMADLPGLIEGAHLNKGMGHKFLKHVERTKLLLMVVDINGFQLSPQHDFRNCLDTIVLLNKELELYNKDLIQKPAMIIINKMDTDGAMDKYEEIKEKIIKLQDTFSDYPEEFRPETALKFDEILPICAKDGGNDIERVKLKVRKLLDIHARDDRDTEKEAQILKDISIGARERGPLLV